MPPTPPNPNNPRRPAPRESLPVAKLLPAVPPAPAARRPAPPPPADPGFEVVDDTVTVRSTKETDADPGFEVVDDPPPRKRKPAVVADGDEGDDAPRAKRPSKFRDDDDGEPRAKRRKKKRRRDIEHSPEDEEKERERENAIYEWGVPLSLMLFGLAMMLFAGFRIARSPGFDGAVTAGAMIGITFVYALIKVPLTIVALMVIGMMVGIEYGTVTSAIRNLAAITFMADGITWLGSSFGLWGVLVYPFAGIVTFALFMTLFQLDTWETWISLFGLNFLSWALKFVLMIIIGLIILKTARSGGFDDDGPAGGRPGWNQKDPKPWNPGGAINRPGSTRRAGTATATGSDTESR